MPYRVTEFESTPNPNAVKCWLDHPISHGPQSFLNAAQACADPLASALFSEAGVTNVLFNGDWMTIGKPADAAWPAIKSKVKSVLAHAKDRIGNDAAREDASGPNRASRVNATGAEP